MFVLNENRNVAMEFLDTSSKQEIQNIQIFLHKCKLFIIYFIFFFGLKILLKTSPNYRICKAVDNNLKYFTDILIMLLFIKLLLD